MAFHTNWGSTTKNHILLRAKATARLTIDGATGALTCNSNKLNFPDKNKINL